MITNTEERSHAEVVAVYRRCVEILDGGVCLTRSDYHEALEAADAAVELAEAARLGEETLQEFRGLQARCVSLLQEEYRTSEHHERDCYNKSTSTKESSSTPPPSPTAAASPCHEDEEEETIARPSSRRRKSVAWFDQATVTGVLSQMTVSRQ
ncbi:uncharacterized protein PG986_011074 [Apiospora aurea]|uniref:Uncharacterized protein n=1 Tax=Apiospora aurea TaxID=335848 RepID=A0ABR1Q416_9PEZI